MATLEGRRTQQGLDMDRLLDMENPENVLNNTGNVEVPPPVKKANRNTSTWGEAVLQSLADTSTNKGGYAVSDLGDISAPDLLLVDELLNDPWESSEFLPLQGTLESAPPSTGGRTEGSFPWSDSTSASHKRVSSEQSLPVLPIGSYNDSLGLISEPDEQLVDLLREQDNSFWLQDILQDASSAEDSGARSSGGASHSCASSNMGSEGADRVMVSQRRGSSELASGSDGKEGMQLSGSPNAGTGESERDSGSGSGAADKAVEEVYSVGEWRLEGNELVRRSNPTTGAWGDASVQLPLESSWEDLFGASTGDMPQQQGAWQISSGQIPPMSQQAGGGAEFPFSRSTFAATSGALVPLQAEQCSPGGRRPPELSTRLAALVEASQPPKRTARAAPPAPPAALELAAKLPVGASLYLKGGTQLHMPPGPDFVPGAAAALKAGVNLRGRSHPRRSRAKRAAADGTMRPTNPHPTIDKPLASAAIAGGPAPEQLMRTQLVAFAEAVAMDEQPRARFLLKVLQKSATPHGNWVQRLTFYCVEALLARISGTGYDLFLAPPQESMEELKESLQNFYDKLGYMYFAQEATNAAIYDAVVGERAVHILDFGVWQGGKWPKLMAQLAAQPGGPPSLQITSIDCPMQLNPSKAQYKLPASVVERDIRRAAQKLGYQNFEFRLLTSLTIDNLSAESLPMREGETLAVACSLRLRNLYDASVVRCNPRDAFLQRIRALGPKVVSLAEMDVDQNGPFFMARFREALDFYGAMFASHDAVFPLGSKTVTSIERNVFARDIINVIACEGVQRVVRCERLDKWQARFKKAGFAQYPLGSLDSAGLRELMDRCPEGLNLIANRAALQLTWKGQPLLFAACWQPLFK